MKNSAPVVFTLSTLLFELKEQGSYYLRTTRLTAEINQETDVRSKVEEVKAREWKMSTIIRMG